MSGIINYGIIYTFWCVYQVLSVILETALSTNKRGTDGISSIPVSVYVEHRVFALPELLNFSVDPVEFGRHARW